MKKTFAILLCAAMLLALIGCGGGSKAPDPTAAPTVAPTEAPAATAAPTEAPAVTEAPAQTPEAVDHTETVEAIRAMIGQPVQALYDFIGQPTGPVDYGSSCLVTGGKDGELHYDGFTVYTLVQPDGAESIYDVEPD